MHFVSGFSADHGRRITCLRTWPKLRCFLCDSRVFWGGLSGSTRVLGMALVAALTLLIAVLPAGVASQDGPPALKVACKEGDSLQRQTVTAAGTVLTVECTEPWTVDPPADRQQVCKTTACEPPEKLTDYAPGAKADAVEESTSKMTITFEQLLKTSKTFYLKCKDSSGKTCNMEVTLDPTTRPPAPHSPSGTPSVQICEQSKASITLKIPEKGSSAVFGCESDFVLYPTEADKVFSKDCKTKETLSDMKRTQTPAAGTPNGTRTETSKTYTYTLEADKKPSKKTLCYVCAKHDITGRLPGTTKDYCTIYVESGARTQVDLSFTFILALPCLLAALQFT